MVDRSSAPTVSVIMSVRDGAATLDAAIRSIVRQTFTDWELILIDDGSRDDGAARAAQFGDPRIRIVRHTESKGLMCRLNEAIDLARGKFIARMDADDISYPERLVVQAAFLAANPELDLVAAKVVVFRGAGEPLGAISTPTTHREISADRFGGFNFPHPTWCGRTAWFRQHRYDERMWKAEDQELLLRTADTSRFAAVDEILLGYRQERLSLIKSIQGRTVFFGALLREARRSGRYVAAARSIVLHLAKFAVEAAAVGFGAEERLMKRKYLPLSAEEIAIWHKVWRDMTCGSQNG
jgi:glycosyltransferase involved in cell wall biosynthesis